MHINKKLILDSNPSAELAIDEPVFKNDGHFFLSTEEAFECTMEKSAKCI